MPRKASETAYTKKTFAVDQALVDQIQAIAYWERLSIKDVVNEAFSDRVAKYEKKHGTLKAVPKR